MEVRFSASASKHGIPREAAAYAVENAVFIRRDFMTARPPATVPPTLFIGPTGPYDQTLLEVFVEIQRQSVKIFHVMVATPATLEYLEEE